MRGQSENALGVDRAGQIAARAESQLQRFSGLVVWNNNDDRLFCRARKETECRWRGL